MTGVCAVFVVPVVPVVPVVSVVAIVCMLDVVSSFVASQHTIAKHFNFVGQGAKPHVEK